MQAGCPGPPQPKLSAIEEQVFTPSCTFSSCHSAGGHAGSLVLVRGRAFAQLVGAPASQDSAAAEGLLRVVPGQPDQSFLVTKLRRGLPARYGLHMPNGQGQIDDGELAAIVEWIRHGAADD